MPDRTLPARQPRQGNEAAEGATAGGRARQAGPAEAASRKLQVGSGDRSQRIRTYNFPQGRITDHRINLTLYKLDEVLSGQLDEILDMLIREDQAEQLRQLGTGT